MMRAALLHHCGAPPAVGATRLPGAGGRPGQRYGSPRRRSRRSTCSAPPAPRTSATPATPYVPGVQGVGERDDGTAVWFATTAGMRPGDGSMAEYAVVPPGRHRSRSRTDVDHDWSPRSASPRWPR